MNGPAEKTAPDSTTPIDQHLVEMLENEKHWEAKPILQEVYREFYQQIKNRVDPGIPGHVVELGSGLGKIKQALPQCITTDIFPNPWLDQVEDAYALSFADGSVSHLILFDVWHHLERTGDALREFRRVLHPQGKVIVFDPAISLLGRLVYGVFHHEPVAFSAPIRWDETQGPQESPYFAAQSFASRVFWFGEGRDKLTAAGWKVAEHRVFPAFDYLASGGFRGPSLSPPVPRFALRAMNALAAPLPRLFGTRLLAVLRPI